MNYTLNQLQIFLKVAETCSITKAATALHLTQPAVSIQLRNFQDQFDLPLTEVVGRKLFITEFGKEVAAVAQNILDQVHAINYKSTAYKGQLYGQLKLAVVSTGKYVMPYFLTEFLGKHPNIELQMDVSNRQKVLESLEQNTIDFALVSILPDKMNIEKVDLIENKLYLVGPAKIRKRNQSAGLHQLTNELPLIYREEGSGTRQSMERFIEKKKISVVKKISLTSNEAVKQAVVAGIGCSIMPLIGIRNEIENGELIILDVKGLPIKTNWSMIWLKGKRHSPVAASFLEYVRDNKEDITSRYFNWRLKYQS